jgi:hypothetical protein
MHRHNTVLASARDRKQVMLISIAQTVPSGLRALVDNNLDVQFVNNVRKTKESPPFHPREGGTRFSNPEAAYLVSRDR